MECCATYALRCGFSNIVFDYIGIGMEYVRDICKLLRHFNDIWMFFVVQLSDRTLKTGI
jgi:hypothetical protein